MPRHSPRLALALTAATSILAVLVAATPVRAVPDPYRPAGAPTPAVVTGRDGYLFFGPDFDQACGYGAHLRKGFRHLAALARTIAASGRRVVFTVAPNKSAVAAADVPHDHPQGRCATQGLRAQKRLLDDFSSRYYLPIRPRVAADRHQTYWRTDPHWTANGGADYSQVLARWLRPSLAAQQHLVRGDETQLGLFNEWLGLTDVETARVARPALPELVTSDPASAPWSGTPTLGRPPIVTDHAWKTAASAHPYPGHTLLIGDSFTLYALGTLRPLLRHGRFLWIDNVERSTMVQAVEESQTVVIEVAQFLVQRSTMGTRKFRQELAAGLDSGKHRGRG